MVARHEERYSEIDIFMYFLCLQRAIERWRRGGKGHRTSGKYIRPGAGFKTGDFGQ